MAHVVMVPSTQLGRGGIRRGNDALKAMIPPASGAPAPLVNTLRQTATSATQKQALRAINPTMATLKGMPVMSCTLCQVHTPGFKKIQKAESSGWWHSDYLFDWAVTACLYVIYWLVKQLAPTRQGYQTAIGNPELSFPFEHNSIPSWSAQLIGVLAPLALAVVAQFLYTLRERRMFSVHDLHHFALGLFTSYAASHLACQVLKLTIGAPRPNYFANVHQATDGRQSFPSGGACTAWTGWTFATLYVTGKLGIFHADAGPVILTLLPLAALVPPTVVSISRFLDYHNRWEDIMGGALIGVTVASFIYRSLFEELWCENSGDPKKRMQRTWERIIGKPVAHHVVAPAAPPPAPRS